MAGLLVQKEAYTVAEYTARTVTGAAPLYDLTVAVHHGSCQSSLRHIKTRGLHYGLMAPALLCIYIGLYRGLYHSSYHIVYYFCATRCHGLLSWLIAAAR